MGRPIILTTLVFALAGCGDTGSVQQEQAARRAADERAVAVEKTLAELRGAIERLTAERTVAEEKEAATAKAATNLLGDVRKDVQALVSRSGAEEGNRVGESGADQELREATLGEAEALIKKLGDKPSAAGLADAIATMDEWFRSYAISRHSHSR